MLREHLGVLQRQLEPDHQVSNIGAGGTGVQKIPARVERGAGVGPREAVIGIELSQRDACAGVCVDERSGIFAHPIAAVGAGREQ